MVSRWPKLTFLDEDTVSGPFYLRDNVSITQSKERLQKAGRTSNIYVLICEKFRPQQPMPTFQDHYLSFFLGFTFNPIWTWV